jgi:hypothetical protein
VITGLALGVGLGFTVFESWMVVLALLVITTVAGVVYTDFVRPRRYHDARRRADLSVDSMAHEDWLRYGPGSGRQQGEQVRRLLRSISIAVVVTMIVVWVEFSAWLFIRLSTWLIMVPGVIAALISVAMIASFFWKITGDWLEFEDVGARIAITVVGLIPLIGALIFGIIYVVRRDQINAGNREALHDYRYRWPTLCDSDVSDVCGGGTLPC